jgi:hypothetical protein
MVRTVNWAENDKWRIISAKTWSLSEKDARLESAKADLRAAGFDDDADRLTTGSLTTVWSTYLDNDARNRYKAARSLDKQNANLPGRAADDVEKKRARKERTKGVSSEISLLFFFFACAEVQGNRKVARSMGLDPASFGDSGAPEDLKELDIERKFEVSIAVDDNAESKHVSFHPLGSAVLIKAGTFDASSKTTLVVRVPGSGKQSRVEAPIKTGPNTLEITVARKNEADFVAQLFPEIVDEERDGYKEKVDRTIRNDYGAHFEYNVLNNAFMAMAPREERWTVVITVHSPYRIGDLKKVHQYISEGSSDSLTIVPLETEEEISLDRPKVTDLSKN